MAFIGVQPTSAPLTASDITDGVVSTAKLGDDAITLAKMASGTDGNVISYDASGNPVAIATGNDGQVLTSTGAGSPPAFEDAGGGRATLIDTITLSSSSTAVFDSSDITSTYDNYLITLENVHPGSGNVEVLMRISNNNGSSYEGDSSNDYRFISFNGRQVTSNNDIESRYSAASNKIGITGNLSNNGNDAALKIDSTIECFSLNSSSYKKFLIRTSFGNTDDPPVLIYEHNLAMADSTQAVINNIKIYPSSGNLASGKIKLFGLA